MSSAPVSIAGQSTEQLGGRSSVLVRQRRDHERLDELLQLLERTEGQAQDRVLRRIDRLVFPHAFAEESVLWPVLRRVVDDGEAWTLEVEREHQEVNALVTRLESLPPGSGDRPAVLARLAEVLRDDVRDEEDELLPRLQAAVAPGELRRLGVLWELVRQLAPTRPHPVVARRPPGNVIAAVPLAVLDRIRDGIDAIADEVPSGAAQPLRTLNRGLTGVAHAVEQLPFLRSGEDPSTRVPRSAAAPLAAPAALAGVLLVLGAVAALRRAGRA